MHKVTLNKHVTLLYGENVVLITILSYVIVMECNIVIRRKRGVDYNIIIRNSDGM